MTARDRFHYHFNNEKRIVLPVIHVSTVEGAIKNTIIAKEAGADGVWLISHGHMDSNELLKTCNGILEYMEDFWVGVNCLGLSAVDVFTKINGSLSYLPYGIWTDNAEISESNFEQIKAQEFLTAQQNTEAKNCLSILHFGGIAFKYQAPVKDLTKTVQLAKPFVDVITTSGPGTGKAADIRKIVEMSEAADGHPLAVASGITTENVRQYLPYVDAFMVATGISKDFQNLDPYETKLLVAIVKSWG